jgi:hypothetical protein
MTTTIFKYDGLRLDQLGNDQGLGSHTRCRRGMALLLWLAESSEFRLQLKLLKNRTKNCLSVSPVHNQCTINDVISRSFLMFYSCRRG